MYVYASSSCLDWFINSYLDADDALDAQKLCKSALGRMPRDLACFQVQKGQPAAEGKQGEEKQEARSQHLRNLRNHFHCIPLGAFVRHSARSVFLIGQASTAAPTQAKGTHTRTLIHSHTAWSCSIKAAGAPVGGITRFLACSRATPTTGAYTQKAKLKEK